MQQQQQISQQTAPNYHPNYNSQPSANRQPQFQPQSTTGSQNAFGQSRKSSGSASGGQGKLDTDKLQSNKILIAQQNIKNI